MIAVRNSDYVFNSHKTVGLHVKQRCNPMQSQYRDWVDKGLCNKRFTIAAPYLYFSRVNQVFDIHVIISVNNDDLWLPCKSGDESTKSSKTQRM